MASALVGINGFGLGLEGPGLGPGLALRAALTITQAGKARY